MTPKVSSPSDDLRVMLTRALQAYELARATYLQTTDLAKAEQERISHLLTLIEQVKHWSRDLLEKAGLAYIAGAPLQLKETAAPTRNNDKAVAAAFSEAQLAYIELRIAVFQLASAFIDSERLEQARRVVQPLLENTQAPLYADARNLACECHYRAASSAQQAKDIAGAIRELHQLALINIRYKKTIKLLEEIFTQEELFVYLSNEDVWESVAQIYLILQTFSGTNLIMRQRLDNIAEFQEAMKAIADIELLWSSDITVSWQGSYPILFEKNLRIVCLTFSNNAKLIALGYQGDGHDGKYPSGGVILIDLESREQRFQYAIFEGSQDMNPVQGLIFENDDFVHIYTQQKSLKLNLTTMKPEPSSEHRTMLDKSQAINSLLLSNIKRKIGKSATGPMQISPNGLYVALAVQKELYIFRKTISSMAILGKHSELVDNSPKEESDE